MIFLMKEYKKRIKKLTVIEHCQVNSQNYHKTKQQSFILKFSMCVINYHFIKTKQKKQPE